MCSEQKDSALGPYLALLMIIVIIVAIPFLEKWIGH